jgi:hypothetical protein
MEGQLAPGTSSFIRDFDATLNALDTALNDATRAVASIRAFVPQISALAQVVTTIESAVSQARENMDFGPQPAAPPPAYQPAPPPATAATLRAVEPTPQADAPTREETIAPATTGSQCLRLQVIKTSGPLDLKAVDTAVNEHPEIVDLALLDYDGRQATLKVWVSGPVDRQAFSDSLTKDLRDRIGEGADVKIDFDLESAAA